MNIYKTIVKPPPRPSNYKSMKNKLKHIWKQPPNLGILAHLLRMVSWNLNDLRILLGL